MVTGESACVDPTKFDFEIGKSKAYEKAFGKLWGLYGFMLTQQLHDSDDAVAILECAADESTVLERVHKESAELRAKFDKLNAFMATNSYVALPIKHRLLLRDQLNVIQLYQSILQQRIESLESE